jgi:ethanolamine utilization protein EutQ (cupin superfamily)
MAGDKQNVLFGDVFDEAVDAELDVTFIGWAKGESGAFDNLFPYDEVFVGTKGSYTVRTRSGDVPTKPGGHLYTGRGNGRLFR